MSDGPSIFGGQRSLFGDEGSTEISVDLNLTPLMDVMSNILFFLLASFGAAILSFMAASVPTEADSDTVSTEVPKTDRVTANIQLKPDGYRVNLSGEKIPAEQLAKFTASFPKVAGVYDAEALGRWAYEVKTSFPGSDTAVLVPSDEVRYEHIIRTMEVVRFHVLEDKRVRLLPKIVVADLVKDTPKPAEAEPAPSPAPAAPEAPAPAPGGE